MKKRAGRIRHGAASARMPFAGVSLSECVAIDPACSTSESGAGKSGTPVDAQSELSRQVPDLDAVITANALGGHRTRGMAATFPYQHGIATSAARQSGFERGSRKGEPTRISGAKAAGST
jgi:hypothetical protein